MPIDEDDVADDGTFAVPASITTAPSSASSSHIRRSDHQRVPTSIDKDDTPGGSLLTTRPPAKKSGFSTDMCALAIPSVLHTLYTYLGHCRYDVEASPSASVMSSASTALGSRRSSGSYATVSRQVHVLSAPLLSQQFLPTTPSASQTAACPVGSSSSSVGRQKRRSAMQTTESASRIAHGVSLH
jgi:hypothetical protein